MKTRGLNYKLPLFEIPMGVRELVENKQVPEVITQGLTKENYATYFNTLLNMEELYLKKEMRCHDMECITMRRKGANLLAWLLQFLGSLREGLLLCMVILLLQCLPLKVKMILLHTRILTGTSFCGTVLTTPTKAVLSQKDNIMQTKSLIWKTIGIMKEVPRHLTKGHE